MTAMPNGNFQKGIWNPLPTNCTQSFTLTYERCAEYGTVGITECINWVNSWVTTCVSGVWNTVKSCSWWSFLFCVLYAIVSTFVCLVAAVIVIVICTAIGIVEYVVCLLWTPVSIIFCLSKANGGTAFLLTDGTVMMQEFKSADFYFLGLPPQATWGSTRWWKLTPDQLGSYANGSWSRLADSSVARTYYASAVLADGRVVVCGGEYSDSSGTIMNDDTNTCECYDPVANTWSSFASPSTGGSSPVVWSAIGDAPCTLLPDGKLLMGSIEDDRVAKLDPVTLTWTAMKLRPGVGDSDEDSWVLMADNTVAAPSCNKPSTTWVYSIASDVWIQGNALASTIISGGETGPALLRYDGTALFLGGNQHTAIYSPTAQKPWSNGPDLPDQDGLPIGILDGPAALLVNGNVLFPAGVPSGLWTSPAWFFEFDGTTHNRTNDPPNANDTNTYATRLLLLPNGDVMFCREDDSSFYAYHSDAAVPLDSYRPVIQICPASLTPGSTIQISGLQFNGLSQAVAYGDDSQTATNYPLVRILNKQSNHVRYCRTSNHTTMDSNGNTVPSMGVATGATVITTIAEIPADIDSGDSSLFVVANGIPSQPFDVTILGANGRSR
jgi:hypothetical protein